MTVHHKIYVLAASDVVAQVLISSLQGEGLRHVRNITPEDLLALDLRSADTVVIDADALAHITPYAADLAGVAKLVIGDDAQGFGDAHLAKPVAPRDLAKALMAMEPKKQLWRMGIWHYRPGDKLLSCNVDEENQVLTEREDALLHILCKNPSITRAELCTALASRPVITTPQTLSTHLSRLRGKLAPVKICSAKQRYWLEPAATA